MVRSELKELVWFRKVYKKLVTSFLIQHHHFPLSLTILVREGLCHSLILDLKTTPSNFFLLLFTSDTFSNSLCITPQFSTALQTAYFFSIFNSLAYKAIQSVFLALQVIWNFLNQLHVFLHFIPSFCIKNHTKGYFGHFLQWSPF